MRKKGGEKKRGFLGGTFWAVIESRKGRREVGMMEGM